MAIFAPDGYNLVLTNISMLVTIPVMNPKLPYHPTRDLTNIAYVAGAPVVIAFGLSVYAFLILKGLEPEKRFLIDNLYAWITLGSLKVDMAFLVDPLATVMILVVTGIGGLIHRFPEISQRFGDPGHAITDAEIRRAIGQLSPSQLESFRQRVEVRKLLNLLSGSGTEGWEAVARGVPEIGQHLPEAGKPFGGALIPDVIGQLNAAQLACATALTIVSLLVWSYAQTTNSATATATARQNPTHLFIQWLLSGALQRAASVRVAPRSAPARHARRHECFADHHQWRHRRHDLDDRHDHHRSRSVSCRRRTGRAAQHRGQRRRSAMGRAYHAQHRQHRWR